MRMLSVLFGALLATVAAAAELPVNGFELSEFDEIDQQVSDFMIAGDIGAGVVSIGYQGAVIYQRHFGWRDQQRSVALGDDTVMRIASLSKVFTAIAVRHLIDSGAALLNSRVFSVGELPGLLDVEPLAAADARLANLSVEHLLLHATGWDWDVTSFYDPTQLEGQIAAANGWSTPLQPQQLIRWIIAQPMQYDPGQTDRYTGEADSHVYSNTGYFIAGYLIEQLTGRSVVDYLHDEVFQNAALTRTDLLAGRSFAADQDPREPWYESTEDAPGTLAANLFYPAYSRRPYVERPYGGWSHENRLAQGGMVASSRALHQVLYDYMTGYSRQRDTLQIGRLRSDASGIWKQGHSGSITGSNTVGWQRSDGVTVAILFNRRPADTTRSYADELLPIIDQWIDNSDHTGWADIDSDGIENALDDFPRSAAASEDFDGDGLPDRFLASCDEDCLAATPLQLDADIDNDGTLNGADPDSYDASVPYLEPAQRRVFDGGGSINLLCLLMLAGLRRRQPAR